MCAALTGAQLANLLKGELTLEIHRTVMRSDSTTVLTWIQSDFCRFKVFVGTRVAEIHKLTERHNWRYVGTMENPADDITRVKRIQDLTRESRWARVPPFLWETQEDWPSYPTFRDAEVPEELRKSEICLATMALASNLPNPEQFCTFRDLMKATVECLYTSERDDPLTAEQYREAELQVIRLAQQDSFQKEFQCLSVGKRVPNSSSLIMLVPELDDKMQLIRVDGRLRHCPDVEPYIIHSVIWIQIIRLQSFSSGRLTVI